MKYNRKVYLAGGSEEGWRWIWNISIGRSGNCGSAYFYITSPNKCKLRSLDKAWCYRNIPSSIMWNTEIHHDWENGGNMYLLSHEEHLKK